MSAKRKFAATPYRRPTRPQITTLLDAALWKAYTLDTPSGAVSMEVQRMIGLDADGKAWRFWIEVRNGIERLHYGFVRRAVYDQ